MTSEVWVTLIGCITIASIIEKFLRHKRELAKIAAKAAPKDSVEATDLRGQLEALRHTSSDYALSLETTQQNLSRRLDSIENRLGQVEQQSQRP